MTSDTKSLGTREKEKLILTFGPGELKLFITLLEQIL